MNLAEELKYKEAAIADVKEYIERLKVKKELLIDLIGEHPSLIQHQRTHVKICEEIRSCEHLVEVLEMQRDDLMFSVVSEDRFERAVDDDDAVAYDLDLWKWGKLLEHLRNQREWSVAELARRSGVVETTIHNWEKSRIAPTMENYMQAISALGFDVVIVRNDEKIAKRIKK